MKFSLLQCALNIIQDHARKRRGEGIIQDSGLEGSETAIGVGKEVAKEGELFMAQHLPPVDATADQNRCK